MLMDSINAGARYTSVQQRPLVHLTCEVGLDEYPIFLQALFPK